MSSYYGASICKNGHVLDKFDANKQKFCSTCGSDVISACPQCNNSIRGLMKLNYAYVGVRDYPRPDYCHTCGKPYPWTELAIKNASLLIQEEFDLPEQLKFSVIESLPDIITETPGTNVAVVRVKKFLMSAGSFTADGLRQFVIDFGCELAKKSIGL